MEANLGTTNLLLGIMAAVSVLEALMIVGVGIVAFVLYRRVTELMADFEKRVEPTMSRVHAILDDVKDVTAKVKEETERVDAAIRTTMDRVDDTAERVRWNVKAKTSRVVGFVRGLRVALEGLLTTHHPQEPRTQYP